MNLRIIQDPVQLDLDTLQGRIYRPGLRPASVVARRVKQGWNVWLHVEIDGVIVHSNNPTKEEIRDFEILRGQALEKKENDFRLLKATVIGVAEHTGLFSKA